MVALAEALFWGFIITAGIIIGGRLLLNTIEAILIGIADFLNCMANIRDGARRRRPAPPPNDYIDDFLNNIGGIGQRDPRRQGKPVPPNPKRRN